MEGVVREGGKERGRELGRERGWRGGKEREGLLLGKGFRI